MRSSSTINSNQSKREAFLKSAGNFYDCANTHAEAGDLQIAATFILKALDQERRARTVGPQVLQLIKPRN